jgi:transcriptional regulator with XRE-family HTH domain
MSKELAAKAGIQASHLSEIENGRRNLTLPVLEKLAAGLGMAPEEMARRLKLMGAEEAGIEVGDAFGIARLGEEPLNMHPPMISRTPDPAALAAHLVREMPREDVFRILRDLTEAGEGGDDDALRKARALLDLIPTSHPTTITAGG